MKKFGNLSLLSKTLIYLTPAFLILLLVINIALNVAFNDMTESEVKKNSIKEANLTENLIQKFEEEAATVSLIISQMPFVIEAYNDPNEELAALELNNKLGPLINQIKNEKNVDQFKIHFHKAPAKSFLRTWTDKRFDDLSGFRNTILEVHKTKSPLQAIEPGVGGFAIRGIAPILDGDKYIGSVEYFSTPKAILEIFESEKANFNSFFLVEESTAKSLFEKKQLEENYSGQVASYYISNFENDKFNPKELLNEEIIDLVTKTKSSQSDTYKEFGVNYIPLKDFEGQIKGMIITVNDYSIEYQKSSNFIITLNIIFAVLIILTYLFIFRLLFKTISKPIKAFSRIIDEIGNGNTSILNENNEEVKIIEKELQKGNEDEIGIFSKAIKSIANNIELIYSEISSVSKAAAQGELSKRGSSDRFKGDYKKMVEELNNALDAIIQPLNVTAEYVDRISKGDIPPKITDNYFGDFNEIKVNLNKCIDSIELLVSESKMLARSAAEGKLDIRSSGNGLEGDFLEIVNGVNRTLDNVIGPLNVTAEYVDRISKGDIPPKITDSYKGDFNEIKVNLNKCIDSISILVSESKMLSYAAAEGKLDVRSDGKGLEGDFLEIVNGVNLTLDNLIAPLNVTAEYVDRISKGDIPPLITDEYKGDFNEIKSNLNLCIKSINSLVEETTAISDEILKVNLRQKADESKHSGSFRVLIEQLNKAVDSITQLFDNIPAPLMAIDNDMNIIFMNKTGASLDNKSTTELKGIKCAAHFKTSDCNTSNCGCYRAINENDQFKRTTVAQPGRHKLDIEYNAVPIRDKDGNVIGAFEIVMDQTDMKNQLKKIENVIAFQKKEAEKLIKILEVVSGGDLDIKEEYVTGSEDTQFVADNFNKIYSSLFKTINVFKDLTNDVNELSHNAVNGNLTFRAEANKYKGDFKDIIEGINDTLNAVVEPINEVSSLIYIMAQGDFRKMIDTEYKGDMRKLQDSLNTLAQSMNELISELNKSVDSTSEGSMNIANLAESLATASEEQSAQAEEVAAAVEEMSKTIAENARSASTTSKEAEQNEEIAVEGVEIVTRTIKKMRDIANVVQISSNNISKLGDSSKQIGEIIGVINDIADQTNLLALNAAIEAARAGDQGRGFAVVADEVRKLAERTSEATKEIEVMIKGIQNETISAVEAMKKGSLEVDEGIKYADQAGEALSNIVESSKKVVEMISQIAAASEEQSATSEEISHNVTSISDVTNESSKRVDEVAQTAIELSKLTDYLSNFIKQFKVVDINSKHELSIKNGNTKSRLLNS